MRIDPDVDRRTARLAERHFGFFTLDQAYACGHTPDSLRTRRRNGIYEREAPGVLRIAGAPRSWQGDAYAAVLAGPPGTLASALTGCALFGAGSPPLLPHIAVPRGSNSRIRNAKVHQSAVAAADRTYVGVIPVTTPARSLVDAAGLVGEPQLCELVDALLTSGATTHAALAAAVRRLAPAPGRKGIPALLRSLEVWSPGLHHDSIPEARLFRLLRQWGFGTPEALYAIRDVSGAVVCEVDAAWPERLVALDYDSQEFHGPRRDEVDERRHAAAEALGWTFVSVDKLDLRPGGQARFRAELDALLPRLAA